MIVNYDNKIFIVQAPGDSLHNISLNAETKSIKTFDFFQNILKLFYLFCT